MLNKFNKETLIIAHRGASYAAPENTIPSFELAFKENADFIEGDFRLTKDGKVVCIHDALSKRTAPNQKSYRVSERTYDDLLSLDFGLWKGNEFAGTKIPTLEEVFAIIPHEKGIVIELKEDKIELEKAIKKIIKDSNFPPKKIIVISFYYEAIVNTIKELSGVKTFWLFDWHYLRRRRSYQKIETNILNTLRILGCSGIDVNIKPDLSNRFAKKMDEENFEFLTYTIDNPESAIMFLNSGVDGITTNYPGKIRRILEDYRKRESMKNS